MLVILNSKYPYRVPLQFGTRVIGNIVQHIGQDNIAKVGQTWQNAFLGTRMVGKLVQRQADNPPFDLTLVDGPIVTTQEIVLGPSETQNVKGATRVVRHTKRVKVIAEPLGELLANRVVSARTYGELKLGSGRVNICLQSYSGGSKNPYQKYSLASTGCQ